MTVDRRTDGTLEESPGDDALRIETLQSMKEKEGAILVLSADGTTAHLHDAVFNKGGRIGAEPHGRGICLRARAVWCNPAAEAQAVDRFRWRTSSPLGMQMRRIGTAGHGWD